jgi:hypothetical protein
MTYSFFMHDPRNGFCFCFSFFASCDPVICLGRFSFPPRKLYLGKKKDPTIQLKQKRCHGGFYSGGKAHDLLLFYARPAQWFPVVDCEWAKWMEKALGLKDVTNSVLAPMPCKVLRVEVQAGGGKAHDLLLFYARPAQWFPVVDCESPSPSSYSRAVGRHREYEDGDGDSQSTTGNHCAGRA